MLVHLISFISTSRRQLIHKYEDFRDRESYNFKISTALELLLLNEFIDFFIRVLQLK